MGRNRVLSFMSQLSAGTDTRTPSPPASTKGSRHVKQKSEPFPSYQPDTVHRPVTPPSRPEYYYGTPLNGSSSRNNSPQQRQRSSSRPLSIVQAYQPPLMDINEDTIPELLPVFSYLNSHSNKLYQEGYFLKLDDQNAQGKPNPDRTWTECFAQLVGTVLSLWDAAELDAAGEDGEVLPKFINLTDASIKMIESLPTRSQDEQPLQNILSISTAGRNRYLLHFNSHHSLIQWTAAIRLAMYEHSTLQEAYTGALIAGKGKSLNNINVIMERSRFKTEEWVRVRFGAGVPWRRCWCVITPPDEKEYAKLQKELKKRSPYDRSPVPVLKGDIKFYDSRKDGKKQKKTQPIATITEAYSAYAIYPQAKSLIDASTLLKIEGHVVVHSDPPSSTEGFIFIMPESHPAVSGFEMLLRFLFPTWDTFGLYGRPGRIAASVLDSRSLMFAMPKHKRYGYLELLDVSTLILEDSNSSWTEKEWRKRLKEATGNRMNAMEEGTRSHARSVSRSSAGGSSGKPRVGFADERGSVRSSRSFSLNGGPSARGTTPDGREGQARPGMAGPRLEQLPHAYNSSDSNLGGSDGTYGDYAGRSERIMAAAEGASSDEDGVGSPPPEMRALEGVRDMHTPEPVSRPPAFNHAPQARPISKAYHSPEMRRANSRLSSTTLAQLATAAGMPQTDDTPARRHGNDALDFQRRGEMGGRPMPPPLSIPTHAQQPRLVMGGLSPQIPPRSPREDSEYVMRPHTSDGRRLPMPPGPPRSPNSQQQHYRPDTSRPLPPPGAFSGAPPPQGRGYYGNQGPPANYGHQGPPANYGHQGPPANTASPHSPRGDNVPFSGPPSSHGGPHGRGGAPLNAGSFRRKPLPAKPHQSLTPNDIIEHYVYDKQRGPDPRRPLPPPGHQQHHGGHGSGMQQGPHGYGPSDIYHGQYGNDGRGAGFSNTVDKGGHGMESNADFHPGPAINYGAPPIPRKQISPSAHGGHAGHGQGSRPYPPEQGPPFRELRGHDYDGGHARGPRMQSPYYGPAASLGPGSSGRGGSRMPSPQPPPNFAGRGGNAFVAPTSGFSGALRSGAQPPHQGRQGPRTGVGGGEPQHYEGQAF